MAANPHASMLMCAVALLAAGQGANAAQCDESRGFLSAPPVYVVSEPDIPLTGFGIEMPPPGKLVPAFEWASVYSQKFVQEGVPVQPALFAKFDTVRLGFLRGCKGDWALGLSMPWQRSRVGNGIGGQLASEEITAIGDLFIGAKKALWSSGDGRVLVLAAGLETPTGMDHATFGQSNAVTNAYYSGYPQRMPLSWQAGSGTWDTILGVSYGRLCNRLSYEGIAVFKINGVGDENVHIGNVAVLAGTATYGISRRLAFSLELSMRSQNDDSYPNAPLPGVNQPALVGTTTHGTGLYLTPSVRFTLGKLATVGAGFTLRLVDPDDGLVPRNMVSLIFYPSFLP